MQKSSTLSSYDYSNLLIFARGDMRIENYGFSTIFPKTLSIHSNPMQSIAHGVQKKDTNFKSWFWTTVPLSPFMASMRTLAFLGLPSLTTPSLLWYLRHLAFGQISEDLQHLQAPPMSWHLSWPQWVFPKRDLAYLGRFQSFFSGVKMW